MSVSLSKGFTYTLFALYVPLQRQTIKLLYDHPINLSFVIKEDTALKIARAIIWMLLDGCPFGPT